MDVILHLGAHRTGSTTFQDYMRRHSDRLRSGGVGYWGPGRTRRGLFSGLLPGPEIARGRNLRDRAEGRIKLRLAEAEARGVETLVISDENMIGTVRANLRAQQLYPGIGEQMARFARAFEGRRLRVMISPRSLELYWSSALAYGVARGQPLPGAFALRKLAMGRRSWRDVITDLACALPGADIRVMPFECFAGRPDALLGQGAGVAAPPDMAHNWLNRAPTLAQLRRVLADRGLPGDTVPPGDGRWTPFTRDQQSALREDYADDMMWLASGADGLAILTEDRARTRAGHSLPMGAHTKGQPNEPERRDLAQPG